MATPIKLHRRKLLDVPIHKDTIFEDNSNEPHHTQVFSANFNSKKMQRVKDKSPAKHTKCATHDNETLAQKLSRKHLSKENHRLSKENEEITVKFNELEELSVRKILKLKEKISQLQNINEEISNENTVLKDHSQELLVILENLKMQLAHCKNCEEYRETIEKFANENNLLRHSKKDLEEDVNMLKTVVYRLNLQMERYQEKLRQLNVTNSNTRHNPASHVPSADNVSTVDALNLPYLSESHQDHTHSAIAWGKVNRHTLGPLLDAYQDTISEKDEIIQSYSAELSDFTSKLKEIIAENEQLYANLKQDKNCSVKLKQEIEGLNKEVEKLKLENDALIRKCALKQDKLDEVIKCYDGKIEQLKRDYSVVHEQYCKSRNEVAALREKNKALIDSQDDFKSERQAYIPVSVHTASVNECKKWYEELKHQYEQEKVKLKENVETQNRLVDELKSKVSACNVEKTELENKIKHLEKQIKKSDAKIIELEHALSEAQFSRSACRKQLHKAMNFAKDLVSEQETLLNALNQRQQENKIVKKIGSDIAVRMDSLRSQLKDVQKGAWNELSTVEKRIQDQNQEIEAMKEEHSHEIERLQQIIKEQEESNLLLKEQTSLPQSQYLL